MKKKLGILLCGVLLAASGSAFAQSHDDGHDRGSSQDQRQDQRQDHRRDKRQEHRQVVRQDRRHYKGMYEQGRHEGWYKRGGRVPASYRGGSYVVTDWRARNLHAPRRGYHYVRSDNGDILLVAISTGIIASILAQH